jgi:hypothetical protein
MTTRSDGVSRAGVIPARSRADCASRLRGAFEAEKLELPDPPDSMAAARPRATNQEFPLT